MYLKHPFFNLCITLVSKCFSCDNYCSVLACLLHWDICSLYVLACRMEGKKKGTVVVNDFTGLLIHVIEIC
jgi:hypothetical protein